MEGKTYKVNLVRIIIVTGSLLFFVFLNGRLHLFDWDEINFAESAREMIITGDYSTVQINYRPFWEKPPLFIWMQALSMHIFGINEFAARFPNAICGLLTLLLLFESGRRKFGFQFGWLWTLVYAGSFLPFFYFKSGIIDPWFNLFIYGSLYTLMLYTDSHFKGNTNLLVTTGGILLGLAILTKGPAAIVIAVLAFGTFLVLSKFQVRIRISHVALYALAVVLTGGSWFLYQLFTGNMQVILDFINYQVRLFSTHDAGHRGFLFYHFVVILVGVFPASLFVLSKPEGIGRNSSEAHFLFWNAVAAAVVLVLFTIVRTKIIHYSSLAYFPVTFIAALFIHRKIQGSSRFHRWQNLLIGTVGFIYLTVVLILPFTDLLKHYVLDSNLIRDAFAVGNLEADGNWRLWEGTSGLLLAGGFFLYLHFNRRKKIAMAVKSLFLANLLFTYSCIVLIVPRIEAYTQRAAIEFCRETGEQGGQVITLGHKSYAIYYYARIQPPGLPEDIDPEDPALPGRYNNLYVIMKNTLADDYLNQYPYLERLYSKNGFVFARITVDHGSERIESFP